MMMIRETEYAEWLSTRPECVRVVGEKLKPWAYYVMRHDNLRIETDSYAFAVYTLYSISEGGTVTVNKHERLLGGECIHGVFGVRPSELIELSEDFDFARWCSDFEYEVSR